MSEFKPFQAIPRYSRQCVITEKIDGTNALVWVGDDGEVKAGSRSKWITPVKGDDNFGFARWVYEHEGELRKLGPGYHYGEWWGQGIQRGYGITPKRFSLFNVSRWAEERPECCAVVPVVGSGLFTSELIDSALESLRVNGSLAAPGFMKPEGVVIYHLQGRVLFKKTLEKDEQPKGVANG